MSTILAGHGTVGNASTDTRTADAPDSYYCYMFPGLVDAESKRPAGDCAPYFEKLGRLADLIDRQNLTADIRSSLPTIYTYFGQFVNHDLSAPTATPRYLSATSDIALKIASASEIISAGVDVIALMSPERPPSPAWLVSNIINQHPEPLGLHSLYGTGPDSENIEIKALYDLATMKFRLGQTFDDPQAQHPQVELDKMLRHDIVRSGGVAKIADRRNDENLIISQLHLAFMLFHNRTIDVLAPDGVLPPNLQDKTQLFNSARSLVTRHYQSCILDDYLKHLVPDEAAGATLGWDEVAALPFEFTTAAFRFGHSMISSTYDYNRFFGADGLIEQTASLADMFHFTSHQNMGGSANTDLGSVGKGKLPTHWVIDWERFFKTAAIEGSGAEPIDMMLPHLMASLGGIATQQKMELGLSSIAHRNLKRGYHRFMPSGQDIADALDITKLTPPQIIKAFNHPSAEHLLTVSGFDTQTPLWVYFLCEAKVLAGGNTLGPLAGAVVRGAITQVMRHNSTSILGPVGRNWTPEESPLRLSGEKAITDIKSFLQFAGVLP